MVSRWLRSDHRERRTSGSATITHLPAAWRVAPPLTPSLREAQPPSSLRAQPAPLLPIPSQVFSPCVSRRSRRAMGQRTTILHAPSSGRKRQRVLADLGPGNPIPHQVLEEDASVVNPAISSVLRCVRGVRTSFRRGKLGELASVRPPAVPSYLSPINYQLKKRKARDARIHD